MRYVLGIDGGGTKTAAVILDEARTERGRGFGGPCNIATCDDATLRASVDDSVRGALAAARLPLETRFASVCAGVAGYTARKRRANFAKLLIDAVPAERHRVEPDFVIAYWGATEGEPGIVVSAGTGTAVYGRNAAGEACRVDGRGFLLGDKGSGFQIGRMALYWTLRRIDEGKPLDEFDRRLLAAVGGTDGDDIIEWVYRDFRPVKIAGLAEQVGAWAEEGVGIAGHLVDNAGWNLHSLVVKAMRRLDMTPDSTAVYTLGGLWNIGPRLLTAFRRGHANMRRDGGGAELKVASPHHDAAYGAALLALQS